MDSQLVASIASKENFELFGKIMKSSELKPTDFSEEEKFRDV
jgi:hypothetical protein